MTVPRTGSEPLSRTGTGSTSGRFERGPVQPVKEKRGPGAAILLVLAPLLCCGGPLLLGALATAGAAALGTAGAVLTGLIAVATVGFWLRRRRRAGAACCPPNDGAWRP